EFVRLRSEILEHLHLAGQSQQTTDGEPPKASDEERSVSSEAFRGTDRSGSAAKPSGASAGSNPPSAGENFDSTVIIIGGGPAGSTLGSYLGRAGIDHLILDQAIHPRAHVGESLVCSTTRIFQEIDFLPVMERERFVHKHGATWTHWADD